MKGKQKQQIAQQQQQQQAAPVLGGRLPLFGELPVVPTLIEEVWVQCDKPNCKKWRKLPLGVKAPPDNVEW